MSLQRTPQSWESRKLDDNALPYVINTFVYFKVEKLKFKLTLPDDGRPRRPEEMNEERKSANSGKRLCHIH